MRGYQLLMLMIFLWTHCVQSVRKKKENPYCYMPPCDRANLPCNHNGLIKECYSHAELLKNVEFREEIEYIFNTLRNNVAGGKIYRNLPTAARMARMSWNKQLAYYARLDVSRCSIFPRPCMSSAEFHRMGSLADIYGYPADNTSIKIIEPIRRMVNGWTGDAHSITRLDTLRLPAQENNILTSILLLIENNSQFGCAALRYTYNSYFYTTLSCVFGTDTEQGQRLYKWGISPGIKCQKRDNIYKNLCASGEKYTTSVDKRKMHFLTINNKWQ